MTFSHYNLHSFCICFGELPIPSVPYLDAKISKYYTNEKSFLLIKYFMYSTLYNV
jgi:hypothetical protein